MAGLLDSIGLGDSGNSGDSSLSPESIAARRKLAEAMLAQGQSDTPIQAHTQGINRVLQSIIGNYRLSQLDQADREGAKAANSQIASIFGGGAATPASPAITPSGPIAAPPQPATPAQGAAAAAGRDYPAPVASQPVDPSMASYSSAISNNESSGNYAELGPIVPKTGDRAYGKYQVMGENVGPWTKEVLGRELTPEQFLGSPQAQELVFKSKFGQYTQKYGPEGAAKAWFAGEGGMNDPNRRDQLGTSVAGYAAKFNAGLGRPTAATPQTTDALVPPSNASQLQRQALELMKNPRNAALGRELLIKAATAEAPKQPEAVQEYALAVKQGYNKPFMDYQIEMKQASRPQTNVSVSGDKKGAEEMAKLNAQQYDKIRAGAGAARTNLANLDTLEGALDTGLNTGSFGETEQGLRKLAQYFGVGNADKVAAGDLVNAISNKLALAVRTPNAEGGGMPGAMSDADRDFLKSTVPGLSRTPEGNRQLIDISRKLAQRSIDMHKLAVQYAQQHEGQIDPGFELELDNWAEANPLFPKVAPKQTAPAGAAAAPKPVASKQEYDALPSGAQYVAPDGSVRTKQ